MFIDQRAAVPQFACQLHLDRNAAQGFDGILSGTARVIGGTAGGNDDFADSAQILGGQGNVVQHDIPVFDSGGHGGLDRSGLLHDLLQHEVFVTALFCGLNIPGDSADILLDGVSGTVEYLNGIGGQLCELSVLKVDDIPCVRDQCSDIRGKEIFANAHSENQRACLADNENSVRFVGADDTQSVGPLQPGGGFHDGPLEIAVVVHLQQMDNDLGVGLAFKMIAFFNQLGTKFHIVFDDPVVHDCKPAVIAGVGMGVRVGRCAMGGPTRMADSGRTGRKQTVPGFFTESGDPARYFADGNFCIIYDGDSRGVIAAVFQFGQTVQ